MLTKKQIDFDRRKVKTTMPLKHEQSNWLACPRLCPNIFIANNNSNVVRMN